MAKNLVEEFVAKLVIDAGMDKMPESFKKDYFEKLGIEVQKRIGMAMLGEMTADSVEVFTKKMDAGINPEEMSVFLRENVPDYEKKAEVALSNFYQEFLASAAKLNASVKNTA